jgi:hypothetical protein
VAILNPIPIDRSHPARARTDRGKYNPQITQIFIRENPPNPPNPRSIFLQAPYEILPKRWRLHLIP